MLVLAVVLLVLLLLLLSPLRLQFTLFDGAPRLCLRYLFLRYCIPSGKKKEPALAKAKKPEKKPKKQAGEKGAQPAKNWDSQAVGQALELVKKLLSTMGRAGRVLLRGLRVRALKLEVMVVKENAHQTAVQSGVLNACAHAAAALLQNFTDIGYLYLNIYPGFWAPKETVAFEAVFSLRPIRLLWAGGAAALGAVPALLRFFRARARGGAAKAPPLAGGCDESGS